MRLIQESQSLCPAASLDALELSLYSIHLLLFLGQSQDGVKLATCELALREVEAVELLAEVPAFAVQAHCQQPEILA